MSNEKKTSKSTEHTPTPPELQQQRTAAMQSVDKMFADRAVSALSDIRCSALEFLTANPGVSKVELAKRLNRGANALGLIIVAYREAEEAGVLRETAQDMLVREILAEFPSGWPPSAISRANVTMGSWRYELTQYVRDPSAGRNATYILRNLMVDNPPPEGWRVAPQNDQRIRELFDRFWVS